jgi:hypothetical protein
MKSILALALLGAALTFCNLGNSNKSKNANNGNTNGNANAAATPVGTSSEPSTKDRFLGTWFVAADSDNGVGPITFKSDNTYSALRNRSPNAPIFTGVFEVKGDRLYCRGDLENETVDGFKLEGERISLKMDGKTVYFVKR